MLTFFEFVNGRRKPGLPGPVTMLARLGIDPNGPSEVEVLRLKKAQKVDDRVTQGQRATGPLPRSRGEAGGGLRARSSSKKGPMCQAASTPKSQLPRPIP